MTHSRRVFWTLLAVFVLGLFPGPAGAQRAENRKPSVALKVSPPVGFTPLRVRVEVDIRGGSDDFQDFYCPTIEWDWGDDQKSESGSDCAPYEAGKSKIERRYTTTYTYRQSGDYKLNFRMKQKGKVVGAGNATIQVRPGLRDFDDQ